MDYCVDHLRAVDAQLPASPAELTARVERLLAATIDLEK